MKLANQSNTLARSARAVIDIALTDNPIVLLIGPRQCGKTTLMRKYAKQDRKYFTLDDETTLHIATNDPTGFIRDLDSVIIDEVQRAPNILLAIKKSVDEDRRPGQFLLTGSADILTLPRVADSLAGRMEIVRLLPLSQSEISRTPSTFVEQLYKGIVNSPKKLIMGEKLVQTVMIGGYPEMIRREEPSRRRVWARDYITTMVERDIRDITEVEKMPELIRLPSLLANYTGQLINYTQLANSLGVDAKTVKKYVTLLEQIFIVRQVQPWFRNPRNRLVRTPKIHFLDSGLLSTLLNVTESSFENDKSKFGPILETFVFSEILKQTSLLYDTQGIYHYRDKDLNEVDVLIEYNNFSLIGIEIKASATVHMVDFRGLRKIASAEGDNFKLGLVMYDGDQVIPFGDRMFAVPISSLWS